MSVVVPELPELAGWRARRDRLAEKWPGDRLPLMTPEEASAWSGMDLDTLRSRVPHFRNHRLIRFFPEWLADVLEGRPPRELFKPEPPPSMHEDGCTGIVYIIEAVGADRVKIGYTENDPELRRRQLQTASPFELRILVALPGSLKIERRLHLDHEAERILPTAEWFHHRGSVAQLVGHALHARAWP